MTTKIVKVRISVAVAPDGTWAAAGASDVSDKDAKEMVFIDSVSDGEQFHFITADVPVPEAITIQGEVE